MFKKIVFATDLSSDWDQIISCAEELKSLGSTHAILAHVVAARGPAGIVLQPESQLKLDAQRKQLESQGFDVIVETPLGLPAFSLNDVTERHGASLIVIGSHGKSALREAVLGSVSNALLHHARFPILLINVKRLREDDPEKGFQQLRAKEVLRHVLFPTDFSPVPTKAAVYLEFMASRGIAEVTVLSALEVPDGFPQVILEPAETAARELADSLVDSLKAAGVPKAHSLITKGHPIPVILEALKTGNFSLIVMGTQGRSLLSEILLGSVAYNIARLAPCPVLLIPRGNG
ncbi:MAG: universal stress protein [Syntrophobacteraceae bacterium]